MRDWKRQMRCTREQHEVRCHVCHRPAVCVYWGGTFPDLCHPQRRREVVVCETCAAPEGIADAGAVVWGEDGDSRF